MTKRETCTCCASVQESGVTRIPARRNVSVCLSLLLPRTDVTVCTMQFQNTLSLARSKRCCGKDYILRDNDRVREEEEEGIISWAASSAAPPLSCIGMRWTKEMTTTAAVDDDNDGPFYSTLFYSFSVVRTGLLSLNCQSAVPCAWIMIQRETCEKKGKQESAMPFDFVCVYCTDGTDQSTGRDDQSTENGLSIL